MRRARALCCELLPQCVRTMKSVSVLVTGTPGFVVGDQVATGATELKNFQALIAKARAGHEAAK